MSETPEPTPPGRWHQFSLARLFLWMTLVSVLAASWAGLTRQDRPVPLGFVLMVAAAPLAMVILLSLFQAICRLLNR